MVYGGEDCTLTSPINSDTFILRYEKDHYYASAAFRISTLGGTAYNGR